MKYFWSIFAQRYTNDLGFWPMYFPWVMCLRGICYKGGRQERCD